MSQAGCTSCDSCTTSCDGGCQTDCYSCVNCDGCVGCNGDCVSCFDGCQDSCQNCTGCAGCTNNTSCTRCYTENDGCISSCQTTCNGCDGCTGGCQGPCQVCQGCTSSCQGGCQTGCQTGCTSSCQNCNGGCNESCYGGCTSCVNCTSCVGCVGCTGCTGCVSCDGCASCTTCYNSCTTGCNTGCTTGCYVGCTTGCDGGCQTCDGGCQGCDSETSPGEEVSEDVIRPGCWNTDSGGFGRNPPTNTGSTEGNYDGENNGPAPDSWLKSGKTQAQWDALSRQGVEDYAKEHGIPIEPTDPKGRDDGTPFIGVEISSVNQALGINGEGQEKVGYKIDYKYNPETGLNEGYAVAEDGTILAKITQEPGSDEFTIENLNNPEGVESSISTVKVDQDTGKSSDLKTETQNSDGSKVTSTEEGTKYTDSSGKTVDTSPTGGGC